MAETKTADISGKLFGVLASALAVATLFGAGELWYQSASLPGNAPHEVTVSGQGKAYAKPDVAVVVLGVHTQSAKSQDAVTQNNDVMNKVISAVKAQGVADQDIQTTGYNLQPVYGYVSQPVPLSSVSFSVPSGVNAPVKSHTVTGYQLDQQVQVKIRDFSKINTILDQATAAGANTAGGLQFTVDNPETVQSQARQKAIAQAEQKAQEMFRQAGLSQGKLVGISEGGSSVPQPLYAAAMAVQSSAPSIQAGQLEMTSNVTLTYEVR